MKEKEIMISKVIPVIDLFLIISMAATRIKY
jgi:hypothetical protein